MANDAKCLSINRCPGDIQKRSLVTAAAATLVVFDHILTIQQEVTLIWRNPWNVTSLLYIWNRYYTLIVLAIDMSIVLRVIDSNEVCSKYQVFEAVSGTVLVITIDVILAFRVWILYEKSRKLLLLLIGCLLVEFIAMAIIAIKAVSLTNTYIHLGSFFKLVGCWPTAGAAPHLFSFYSTPTMIVSFVMFLMTVYRCIFWNNQIGIPIFNLFLRDGVFWFLAILLVLLPEIATAALPQGSRALSLLMVMPTFAVYSLIGSRVLLNIKGLLAVSVVSGNTVDATFGDHVTEFRAATAHRSTNFTIDAGDGLSRGHV
ncbi:hypothetical protein BD779DRAFT_1791659 [Infundibulicybe gibba]|nr:hypothetical protein BD779DRAFT_1791659 [Infundibulicybe gibba]